MKPLPVVLVASLLAASLPVSTAVVQADPKPISESEARQTAVDAYVYLYPLVTMDLTRKQLINTKPEAGGMGGPMNAFNNIAAFPTADMRAVVRPNFDTLYSSAWVDLT